MSKLGKRIEKMLGKTKEPEGIEATEASPTSLPPKVYLKALPLRELGDVEVIKQEVKSGNILVIRVTPLAKKSIEDVKRAVNELSEFIQSVEGDIARLGEERVVICPSFVKIWRGAMEEGA